MAGRTHRWANTADQVRNTLYAAAHRAVSELEQVYKLEAAYLRGEIAREKEARQKAEEREAEIQALLEELRGPGFVEVRIGR